jgi:hypothetical protein
MSTEDVLSLNSGFIVIAPSDRMGNFVLVFEPSKTVGHSKCSQRRCYFYFLNVLIEQMITGKEKLVILLILGNMSAETFNSIASFKDIGDVFPLETSFLHVFLEPVGLGWLAYISAVNDILENIFNIQKDCRRIHTLQGSISELLSVMYGLQAQNLPVSIGGLLDMEAFRLWQIKRSRLEWQRQTCEKQPFAVKGYNLIRWNEAIKMNSGPTILELDDSLPCNPSVRAETRGRLSETSTESIVGISLNSQNEIDDFFNFGNDDDSTMYSISTQLFD